MRKLIQDNSIVFMDHTYVNHAGFGHQIVCDCALANSLSLEFPIQGLSWEIHFQFYSAKCSGCSRLSYLSPRSWLLLFEAISIMYFSICEVQSQGFYTYFIFRSTIIFRHDPDFNAVKLWLYYRDCSRVLVVIWKNLFSL